MIAYFPEIYPDELFYSIVSRYHTHSGNVFIQDTTHELFGQNISKKRRIDTQFITNLSGEGMQMATKKHSMNTLIKKHTMYPFYGKFLTPKRQQDFYHSILTMEAAFSRKIKNISHNRFLQYCPVCAEEDRKRYGETYWHREHQIVSVCPKHHCRILESTAYIYQERDKNLVIAEEVIKNGDIQTDIPKKEIYLADYIANVFHGEIGNGTQIRKFFQCRLIGTEYLSARGESIHTKRLWDDYREFYKEVPEILMTYDNMRCIFKDIRPFFTEICAIAMFLEIKKEELIRLEIPEKMPEEIFDEEVQKLRYEGREEKEIAKIMGVSIATVRSSMKIYKKRTS